MANKINLITGETYTLAELFSGERKIIIPDLQRDYCWGNKGYTDDGNNLVKGFLDTLLRQFKEHPYGKLNLGLLYGYEAPENFVQLCDGQQRITTLFLLVGMLNKWSGENMARRILMSDFEYLKDDHEPYLQYAVRETSLYFLSDLVYRFFAPTELEKEKIEKVEEIYDPVSKKSCSWFYGEYSVDPSVISMLSALKTIESYKDRIVLEEDNENHIKFFEFLTERLTFLYYDMGTRLNGEETYVIINTTGEPLTPTENLKPLVLNAEINHTFENLPLQVGQKMVNTTAEAWEELETWFWQHRDDERFDTAAAGFNEFLRWVNLLYRFSSEDNEKDSHLVIFREILKNEVQYPFPYEEISIKFIIDVFNAFYSLYQNYSKYLTPIGKNNAYPGQGDILNQIQIFVFLPLLEYLIRNPETPEIQIKRLYNFLRNLTRISNVTKDINNLVDEAVSIGANCRDVIDALYLNGLSKVLMSEEEIYKLRLFKHSELISSQVRENLEDLIWEAQDLLVDDDKSLFGGEISSLLAWASPDLSLDVNKFNVDSFSRYLKIIKLLFKNKDGNDLTRRALLAYGLSHFPWGVSYGWGDNWKEIFQSDLIEFRNFLDTYKEKGLDNIISQSSFNVYVAYPQLLAYSNRKNIRNYRIWGPTLCRREWAEPLPVQLAVLLLRLGLDLNKGSQHSDDYKVIWMGDNNLIFDKNNLNGINHKIMVSSISEGRILSVTWQYSNKEEVTFEYTREWEMDRFINYLKPSYKLLQDKRRSLLKTPKGRKNKIFRKGRISKRGRAKGGERRGGVARLTY